MRLVYPLLDVELCLSINSPTVLVLEDKAFFLQFVFDLWNHSQGKEGNLLLSEKDKPVKVDKNVEVVINPFAINLNDKKILTKVYSELEELCNESYIEEISAINANIVSLMDMLEQSISYPIKFDIDVELKGLFKLQCVKIEESDDGLLDRLVSYIKLLHQICAIRVFVFVNLKAFLSSDMIAELYKACIYEEVIVIDVESHDYGKEIESEQYFVIDQELCFIEA